MNHKIISKQDGLPLELTIIKPKTKPKGIVQISHGMAEHKERYYDFMNFLAKQGYVCIIHDHRGHGASVKSKDDLGYFYTKDSNYIVEDLYQVTEYIKKQYENLNVILFSHSMGTLVARNYLKKYDNSINKIILCGPPTKNNLTPIAIMLAQILCLFGRAEKQSKFLNKLTFGNYNKNHTTENAWICSNEEERKKYNEDPLCGNIFTTNGFLNLFQLMKEAFRLKNWQLKNRELKIYIIAGKDDPVIQNENKFRDLIKFLKKVGYQRIESKLYDGKRHELLNESGKEEIYQDIIKFIEK